MLYYAFRVIYIHTERENNQSIRKRGNNDENNHYLGWKENQQESACEQFGKEDMERKIKEAKQIFREDPWVENSWWMGNGMLTISFR